MTIIESPSKKTLEYYKSIKSVRETTSKVFDYILKHGEGKYFALNLDKVPNVVDFVVDEIIRPDYPTDNDLKKIPPHGRWQHINASNIDRMSAIIKKWENAGVDEIEICKKIIDLFVFSVLIDAGAGTTWKYYEESSNTTIGRSEGLAVASINIFSEGKLSNDPENDPFKVNGLSLKSWTLDDFKESFQITDENNVSGLEGRLALIKSLGEALCSNSDIFGSDARPGNLIDYLYKIKLSGYEKPTVDLSQVWDALMEGLVSIWPKGRLTIAGHPLGDAWYCDSIPDSPDNIVTFHKLTQWLCYSLLIPLEKYGYKFNILNTNLQTGLPEYRNGGLFLDFDVITLKEDILAKGLNTSRKINHGKTNEACKIPSYEPHDGVIVEWRCLTVGLLDYILPLVNAKLNYDLELCQLIEAGSWKGGRVIAMMKRPEMKGGPPINLISDGTVF